MKLLFIPAIYLFQLLYSAQNGAIADTIQAKLPLTDSIKISSKFATDCKKSGCMLSIKEQAKAFKHSVVLYKKNNKWLTESNGDYKMALIDSYKGNHIILWYGNVDVKGIEIKDQKNSEVVQLN